MIYKIAYITYHFVIDCLIAMYSIVINIIKLNQKPYKFKSQRSVIDIQHKIKFKR